jgi:superfamily I DNA/RNA helicase
MASPGDFILCRTTAPLVDFFFRLIAEGKSAKVLGKDYCDALEPIVHVLQSKFEFSHYGIQSYWEDKLNQKRDKKHELLRIREKLDILEVIVKLTNGRNPIDTIRGMFSNTSSENCITLSTIHRVKGLEANRVFLIRPDLLPHPSAEQDWEFVQENNLQYVAVTRAKKEFYYVK